MSLVILSFTTSLHLRMWDDKGHLALDGWRLKDWMKNRLGGQEPGAVGQADGHVQCMGKGPLASEGRGRKGPLASEGVGLHDLTENNLEVVRQLLRLQLLLHDE